jgi:hypothetical protein
VPPGPDVAELRDASDTGGLKLTVTDYLSRSVVAEMCRKLEWPSYDREGLFNINNVINEPDFLPLHFLRILMLAAKPF